MKALHANPADQIEIFRKEGGEAKKSSNAPPVVIVPFSVPAIGAILNGFIALAVTFICLIIFDLDDPFEGQWAIGVAPFERLLVTLRDE